MDHYDVIVIGSGAGGGTLAHALAPTGKRILILERGGYTPTVLGDRNRGPVEDLVGRGEGQGNDTSALAAARQWVLSRIPSAKRVTGAFRSGGGAVLVEPELAKWWVPRILAREYDQGFKPAEAKSGIDIGMGLTDKQGATDVRPNTHAAGHARNGGPRARQGPAPAGPAEPA